MVNRRLWVYDIETFANFFSCIYYNVDTLERMDFIVCEWQDDLAGFVDFTTSDEVKGMIGYNNIGFDYPCIHNIITKPWVFKNMNGKQKAEYIKNIANTTIEKLYSSVSPKDVKIYQLDLYRVHHFDNKAKSCSLKQCEFVMRWKNLMDLPFHHNHVVKEHETRSIMEYNFNDVLATFQLYKESQGKIELRKMLTKTYGIDLINANDPKIGSEIFAKYICQEEGMTWSELKDMRTIRESINLADCIFPYVKFESKEFNDFLKFFKSKVITETKGVFKDLIVKYKGLSYVYGLGGFVGPLV